MAVRDGLRGNTPLTFQQLSWPDWLRMRDGKGQSLYESCAELFYESLLHFNDGQTCFRRMLAEMPKHMNWQTAFLMAFHSHFAGLLDVEKWWGLDLCRFRRIGIYAGRGQSRNAGTNYRRRSTFRWMCGLRRRCCRRRRVVTLQEVIMQWDDADALAALQRAVRELEGLQWNTFRTDLNLDASVASQSPQRDERTAEALRLRMSAKLSPLVNRYLTVLLNYMKEHPANDQDRPTSGRRTSACAAAEGIRAPVE